jgi:trehalose synthase-fused probable maltokinase
MADAAALLAGGDLSFVDDDALAAFVAERRWFGSRQRVITHVAALGAVPVSSDPAITIVLSEVRFQTGAHDVYQLVLGLRTADGPAESAIWPLDGLELYDAADDPRHLIVVLEHIRANATLRHGDAAVEFRIGVGAEAFDPLPRKARPVGGEQTNTSVVFDDRMILKCYRRLEAGINPELELLRFLAARDFGHVPRLLGWFEHRGGVMDATLGVLQEYRTGATDGWELILGALREGRGDDVIDDLRHLGAATGELHATLASDRNDPAFVPEEVSPEGLALMSASLDELANDVFGSLPDDPALAPIVGRGDEVRDRLRTISKSTGLGRKIRVHGDLHLGQALWSDARWHLIDFEGEPARPVNERRRKRSPLRDLAGLLRSLAYAAGAASLHHHVDVPADWLPRARAAVMDGYFAVVEPTGLLPPSGQVTDEVLALYELEKAVYELRYELGHRPGWVAIPVQSITQILDQS